MLPPQPDDSLDHVAASHPGVLRLRRKHWSGRQVPSAGTRVDIDCRRDENLAAGQQPAALPCSTVMESSSRAPAGGPVLGHHVS